MGSAPSGSVRVEEIEEPTTQIIGQLHAGDVGRVDGPTARQVDRGVGESHSQLPRMKAITSARAAESVR